MTESSNQIVATLTAPDHEPDVDKATSTNQDVAKVISKPSLLDLPPEIRLMIYRHLLVRSSALPQDPFIWCDEPQPAANILKTCRLIYREASHILYTENTFRDFFWYPCSVPSPRIEETLQNVEFELELFESTGYLDVERFLDFAILCGYPSAIRGKLAVIFKPQRSYKQGLIWFVRVLNRFRNFRTIELYFDNRFPDVFQVREWLETALEPVLGRAEVVEKFGHIEKGLRFHPVDHRNLSKGPDDADWVEFLNNGIHKIRFA